jgi:hypothetical protein
MTGIGGLYNAAQQQLSAGSVGLEPDTRTTIEGGMRAWGLSGSWLFQRDRTKFQRGLWPEPFRVCDFFD